MGYSKTGVITYKKKPEKGEPGPKGPFVYPAGIYVQGSDTQYTATALTAPMVVFEKQMYILNVVGTVGSQLNPKDDYAVNGSKATWVLMPQYKAAYYEIFFAEFAKLGSAIFSGDYMLSQHGVDAQGRESTDFEKFNPATNDFTPNIMIDWLTGKMKGKNVEIEGEINATKGKIADFKIIEHWLQSSNMGLSGSQLTFDAPYGNVYIGSHPDMSTGGAAKLGSFCLKDTQLDGLRSTNPVGLVCAGLFDERKTNEIKRSYGLWVRGCSSFGGIVLREVQEFQGSDGNYYAEIVRGCSLVRSWHTPLYLYGHGIDNGHVVMVINESNEVHIDLRGEVVVNGDRSTKVFKQSCKMLVYMDKRFYATSDHQT